MKFSPRSSKFPFLEDKRTNQTRYVVKTIEFTKEQSIRGAGRQLWKAQAGRRRRCFPQKKRRGWSFFSQGKVAMAWSPCSNLPLWYFLWKRRQDGTENQWMCLVPSFPLFRILASLSSSLPHLPVRSSGTSSALSHPTFPSPLVHSFSPSPSSVTHCYGYVARYPSHPHLYSIIYKLPRAHRHRALRTNVAPWTK